MTNSIQTLEPLKFPLSGSHLIEASAGTGKTYTIAMLYVRLVLGHGGTQAFAEGRPLTPPEILVVTFTDAATKELRDRIRARLTEAARCFRNEPDAIGDKLLVALREDFAPEAWPVCARKLEVAAEWMDEAAVSTIHGWCNRMLREHAFDSQSLFVQNLETDQTELLEDVVRDYWRIFYYPLATDEITCLTQFWQNPESLKGTIRALLEHSEKLPVTDEPAIVLRKNIDERKAAFKALKAPWLNWADELQGIFDKARDNKEINGKALRQNIYTGWFDKLRNWASSDEESLDIGKGWERLTPAGLAEVWLTAPPVHAAFEAVEKLRSTINELEGPYLSLVNHAARWIAKSFEDAQKHRAQIGFDDLLTGLESALAGPHGTRLAETIRTQFPVALIDEFQDTDPVQYRIFERVYAIAENRQDSALILIGDPKQAIYAFRGADIYTYLKAREAVGHRLYTLDTNYRSTTAMVNAANHCFAHIEAKRESQGAFLFRSQTADPVPFIKVKANGRKDAFTVGSEHISAMRFALLESTVPLAKGAYTDAMANAAATQIVQWLNNDKAGFTGENAPFQRLAPSDIAVLVNSGIEAAAIRDALAERAIRSVYLSDKDTVFATAQAQEIHRWLLACAEPDNDRLLRAALATASLGLDFSTLDALNTDEQAWEERVLQFKGYQSIWQKRGILPMLRTLLRDFGCNDRLLTLQDDGKGQSGERILTDLLHLAELLQEASFTLDGEHALIRYLAEQIADPTSEAEGKKLRLESDAALVKVITIHKSKGLEYPIVFLPFVSATRLTKSDDLPLKWHNESGELQISLESNPDVLAKAEEDRLGEDLRKLYVAFTRARYVTWVGLASVDKCEPSAIGHLCELTQVETSEFKNTLAKFAQGEAGIEVTEIPAPSAEKFIEQQVSKTSGQARRPSRAARENWWISSYSSLPVEGHTLPDDTSSEDTAQAENLREGELERHPIAVIAPKATAPIHRFPKGAEAGTFLHDIMEWVANQGFTTVLNAPEALRDMIARRCQVRQWEHWVEPIFDWANQMLTTPLKVGSDTLALNTLETTKAEMEFWFAAQHVPLSTLDQAITTNTLAGRPRPPLSDELLNGMLKGFMDLVFKHDERYFILDYKSNWLGSDENSYTSETMDSAIRTHRYDLQYVIYLLALHRLLKTRLPDYDYDKHVGGAAYLFVRGLNAPTTGVHFERPPKALIDFLDRLFSGSHLNHDRSAA